MGGLGGRVGWVGWTRSSVSSTHFLSVCRRSTPGSITGDLNVHVDLGEMKMNAILHSFHLVRFVSVPTHDHNGYLDVIISDSDRKPEVVTVDDLGPSDHFLMIWLLIYHHQTQSTPRSAAVREITFKSTHPSADFRNQSCVIQPERKTIRITWLSGTTWSSKNCWMN